MPKRILAYAFAVASLALAACNSNPSNLFGSATATPVPTSTASPSPDPSASTAVVSVFVAGSPQPNQPVTLSSQVNGSVGTTIRTQSTDSTGKTTFSNLTPTVPYCFSSTFQPTPAPSTSPAPLPRTQTECTPYWGTIGVTLAF